MRGWRPNFRPGQSSASPIPLRSPPTRPASTSRCCSWALPDFVAYLEALNKWLGKSVFLEPGTPYPDLARWPGDLKPPPPEPPALWNELLLRLRQPNPDGFVAAAMLQLMATARGVVRYREGLPQ